MKMKISKKVDDASDDEDYYDDIESVEIESNQLTDEELPLYQRIEAQMDESTSASSKSRNRRTKGHRTSQLDGESYKRPGKDRNAPATQRSDRPVPILRCDNFLSTIKTYKPVDPRFSTATGTLNYDKFLKNYTFLDEQHEQEVNELQKKIKKCKNVEKRDELKQELSK